MIWLPRTTDNSTYFAKSLEIRGIESRLYLESIILRLATSKILILYLVYVAEQPGLNLTFSETLKTGFLATRPI